MKKSSVLFTFALYLHFPFTLANDGKYIQIDEALNIYYEQRGLGEQAIVFIPGWSMSSQIFKYQLDYFAESKKFKVLAYDPRGQGLSSKTISGHTYTQRGKDLAQFIDKMRLTNMVLVGWSFGTLDMLSYISQYGIENVRAVVVLDGTPTTMLEDVNNSWAWIDNVDSQSVRRTTTLAVLDDPHKFYHQFASWMLNNQSPEKLSQIVDIAMQTPPFVAALTNETASYANYEEALINLEGTLPLYFIVREEWSHIVELWRNQNTPSAKLSSMGRHLMFWEHHSEFNPLLEEFLNAL